MKLGKIFIVLFLCLFISKLAFADAGVAGAVNPNKKNPEEKTFEEKYKENEEKTKSSCSDASDEISAAKGKYDLGGFCASLSGNYLEDLKAAAAFAKGLANSGYITVSKKVKPTPMGCDCNEFIFPKFRPTEWNYKALNHLFQCVGDYIRHWQDYTFEAERLMMEGDDGKNLVIKRYKKEHPYEAVVAKMSEGSSTPWRYNIFLPGIKREYIENIVISENIEKEPNIKKIIAEDNDKFLGYVEKFIEDAQNKREKSGQGFGKYCHAINEKQWNPEYVNKLNFKRSKKKGEKKKNYNPKKYLPYEKVYNPEQTPWYPRNTKVATINTSMEDGVAVGDQIKYMSTRVKMETCSGEDGCHPCDENGDKIVCTPSWWHTEYGLCGEQAPKCNGNIRESVDILEGRAGEYRRCLDLFTFFKCLKVNCINIDDPYFEAIARFIGTVGLEVMEGFYPASGGYCCSIIEAPVTPADAMGLHYNIFEVRDYRNAWRDWAPSTRPNLEELSIGAPESIYNQLSAHKHLSLDGLNGEKDMQEYNYWWPWWARTGGGPISRNCQTKASAGFGNIVMAVVKPYWTWPDTGTTSPHNDPFHDSISPGVPGANCGYGGWAETKLYQARCMRLFKMNCICRYEQTFKKGSSESFVLKMLGGQYVYKDENNITVAGYWPFPWQGYASSPITQPKESADNKYGFPIGKNYGYFEEVKGGLDNAEAGDIVVWDHSRGKHPLGESSAGYNSSYQMLPHTAYIKKVNNQASKAKKKEVGKSLDYVEVSEFNYGKIPDSCGNTTNWCRQTNRVIYPYETMNRDEQLIDKTESSTCLDPDNKKCEDPFWEVGQRSPKVYRLKDYKVSNSDKCNYTGLDSYEVLVKEYQKADKKFNDAGKPKGKSIENYLGNYYKLKEQIEKNIANGCYPPKSWNEPIKNKNPEFVCEEGITGFLNSRQIHEEIFLGKSLPVAPVYVSNPAGGVTGSTESVENKPKELGMPNEFGEVEHNLKNDDDPKTNPYTPANPKKDCYYVATINSTGNPELILDTIWDTSKEAYNEISTIYNNMNSLGNIVENGYSGAEAKLKELVANLKSENDRQTEDLMALMSYQYYDKCCSTSAAATNSKNLALERRDNFKKAIEKVEEKISNKEEIAKILPDLRTAITEHFYFEAYTMDSFRNILQNLSGCSGSSSSNFTPAYNNIVKIINSLKSIESMTIETYRKLADVFYDDNYGALKISKSVMKTLENISDDIYLDVQTKSRKCYPDKEVCNVDEKPAYNPLIIGKKSANCSYLGNATDDEEPLGLTCQEPPKTCSEAADCWREPTEPTCDAYGELNFAGGRDNPFVEYSLDDEKHRDVGYSRDLIAKYLYTSSSSDFSTADKDKYIIPLVNNFPVEWCELDFVKDRVIKSENEIKIGKTIAVITSDRYKRGHASLVYEYDATNSCVYLYGQNWLTHKCQQFTEGNCYQSYSSFNKPSVSNNCIPIKDISYMWNAVCDEKHPCDD